jgi:hypothetical protein
MIMLKDSLLMSTCLLTVTFYQKDMVVSWFPGLNKYVLPVVPILLIPLWRSRQADKSRNFSVFPFLIFSIYNLVPKSKKLYYSEKLRLVSCAYFDILVYSIYIYELHTHSHTHTLTHSHTDKAFFGKR